VRGVAMALVDFSQVRQAASWNALVRRGREAIRGLLREHGAAKKMAGAAFAVRVGNAAIVFITQVLLARWIGAYEFGGYVYVLTWLLLASDLVHLGLPLTAQRFIPEYTQAQELDLLRGYLSGSRWLAFGAGTAVAIAGALVVYFLKDPLGIHLVLPFYFACAALPFYSVTFMTDGLARSYNWVNVALLPAYVIRPVLFLAGLAGLHLAGAPLNATTVMGMLAIAAWCAALAQMIQVNRKLRAATESGPKRYDLRRWLGTAMPIILVWGLYTLLTSIDVLLLKQFRPEQEVAHYYAAAKVLALVSIIYFAVAAATAHRFTAFHVNGDREGLARFTASTVRWVFWPSLALSLLIMALGRPLLMLFGPDFVAGYPVLLILAAGMIARASVGPAERLLNVLGHQRACAVVYAAAFAFDIGACLLLAPTYGAKGAAIATAGAFVVESALLFAIAKRGLGLHMFVWRWQTAAPARRAAADMVNQSEPLVGGVSNGLSKRFRYIGDEGGGP
jgi:O-antigen/teichoic acid export membrane protein